MARVTLSIIKIAAACSLPIVVAACGATDRIRTSSVGPDSVPMQDYRIRHPIAIAEARTAIDVFPSMGQSRLDRHTAKQVYAFAEQYRDTGQGPILVLVPRGGRTGNMSAALADIRRVLQGGGARNGVNVSTYPVVDPRLASPIRLSFTGIKAQVADQCGQWPSDLASGSNIEGWQNKTYWNFGCSTQSMMAAQVSDPRDLVTPRGEEPADTLIRSRAIDAVRKGTDPNTSWQVKNTNIGGVGGS